MILFHDPFRISGKDSGNTLFPDSAAGSFLKLSNKLIAISINILMQLRMSEIGIQTQQEFICKKSFFPAGKKRFMMRMFRNNIQNIFRMSAAQINVEIGEQPDFQIEQFPFPGHPEMSGNKRNFRK